MSASLNGSVSVPNYPLVNGSEASNRVRYKIIILRIPINVNLLSYANILTGKGAAISFIITVPWKSLLHPWGDAF